MALILFYMYASLDSLQFHAKELLSFPFKHLGKIPPYPRCTCLFLFTHHVRHLPKLINDHSLYLDLFHVSVQIGLNGICEQS